MFFVSDHHCAHFWWVWDLSLDVSIFCGQHTIHNRYSWMLNMIVYNVNSCPVPPPLLPPTRTHAHTRGMSSICAVFVQRSCLSHSFVTKDGISVMPCRIVQYLRKLCKRSWAQKSLSNLSVMAALCTYYFTYNNDSCLLLRKHDYIIVSMFKIYFKTWTFVLWIILY